MYYKTIAIDIMYSKEEHSTNRKILTIINNREVIFMTNNGQMYTTVIEKLKFEPKLDDSNITVSIQGDHDIVVLGGKVSSYNEKLVAEKAIKSLAKVRSIANKIEIDLDIKYTKSDVDLAKSVTHALKSSASVPSDNIQSVIQNGIVSLTGEVIWQFQKNNAFNTIKDLVGVKSIINKITIKQLILVEASKVQQRIIEEFERHARLDANKIKVIAIGNKVTLEGKVSSFSEIDDAEDAAWSIPGVQIVENYITLG